MGGVFFSSVQAEAKRHARHSLHIVARGIMGHSRITDNPEVILKRRGQPKVLIKEARPRDDRNDQS